jgi:hypothetical protein
MEKMGLRDLFSRVFRTQVPARRYAVLLLPPLLVLTVLSFLEKLISPVYAPNRFFIGVLIWNSGWLLRRNRLDGIRVPQNAFPKQRAGAEHSARVDLVPLALAGRQQLGTAALHGVYWLRFFLAFSLAMTAMRLLNRMDLHEHEKRVLGAAHAC